MSIVAWDPFRDIDQLFNRYNRGAEVNTGKTSVAEWTPLVDIYEADGKFLVRAELAGVDKDDVNVSIDENLLTIKGKKQFVEAKEGEKWKRVETQYGEFSRSFTLPDNIDADKVSAAYKDGVLELSVPKTEPAKPKLIDVKVH